MGNKFIYDERVEEIAVLRMSQEMTEFKTPDHYFRSVLERLGAGHCGYYPTFQDLNVIRAAQSITIKKMFEENMHFRNKHIKNGQISEIDTSASQKEDKL